MVFSLAAAATVNKFGSLTVPGNLYVLEGTSLGGGR